MRYSHRRNLCDPNLGVTCAGDGLGLAGNHASGRLPCNALAARVLFFQLAPE
jgi:hypothetical protein